jgi:hypothetical protein
VQASLNQPFTQFWEITDNFFVAHAIVQPAEYIIHADAGAGDARTPKPDFRVDANQRVGRGEVHHSSKLRRWILVKRQHLNDFADADSTTFMQVATQAAFDMLAMKGAGIWIYNKHIS